MKQQGRCVLPADETGRVLDRLTALEKVISPTDIRQALEGDRSGQSAGLQVDARSYDVDRIGDGYFHQLANSSGVQAGATLAGRARTRPVAPRCAWPDSDWALSPCGDSLNGRFDPLATPDTPGAFYRGLRLVAVDGTLEDVPDTSANDAAFGRPTSGKRGDGAFPQVRKLSLVEVGTHVEFALCTGSYRTGEKTMFPQLLPHLQPGMLLLCDRGFFSYNLWKSVISRGVHLLARLSKGMILKPIQQLSDGSYLAKIYRQLVRPQERPRRNRGARDQVHAGRSATRRPSRRTHAADRSCWTRPSIPLGN